jgi:hypothetical protein
VLVLRLSEECRVAPTLAIQRRHRAAEPALVAQTIECHRSTSGSFGGAWLEGFLEGTGRRFQALVTLATCQTD